LEAGQLTYSAQIPDFRTFDLCDDREYQHPPSIIGIAGLSGTATCLKCNWQLAIGNCARCSCLRGGCECGTEFDFSWTPYGVHPQTCLPLTIRGIAARGDHANGDELVTGLTTLASAHVLTTHGLATPGRDRGLGALSPTGLVLGTPTLAALLGCDASFCENLLALRPVRITGSAEH